MSDSTTSFATELGLPRVILASGSPRRRLLLDGIGLDFSVVVPDVNETTIPGETPSDYVRRLARTKADAIARDNPGVPVIGSDTSVVLEEEILGKPENRAAAIASLEKLSGREHRVLTSFSIQLRSKDLEITEVSTTTVRFRALERNEIEAYVATGSPMDKAGGYGIQDDVGALFVEGIDGDYHTVVGLPIARVYLALKSLARRLGDRIP